MDWPIDDDELEPTATQSRERLEVPEGVNEMQIRQVLPSDDKLELRLAHDDRKYGWVFVKLKRDASWAKVLVSQLRHALGLTAAEWRAMDYGDLVGRRLMAEIRHKVASDGRMYVNVWAFSPLAEPAPAAQSAVVQMPKATAIVARPATGSDDIPF